MTGAFLATGHARADEKQPFAFQIFCPAVGVLEKRVAAIDDDVARFEERDELFDEVVHRLAGFDHEHHASGLFEEPDHFLEGMGAEDACSFGLFGEEFVHFGDGAIKGDDGVADEPQQAHYVAPAKNVFAERAAYAGVLKNAATIEETEAGPADKAEDDETGPPSKPLVNRASLRTGDVIRELFDASVFGRVLTGVQSDAKRSNSPSSSTASSNHATDSKHPTSRAGMS